MKVRTELEKLHEADVRLKERQREAWEQYRREVEEILDEVREELSAN